MISPNLLAERESLLAQIAAIRESGDIAPPNVRIEPDFLNPKCWLLANTSLPMKERKLGQAGSPKHHDWIERIHRRDRFQELEQQLTLLQGLIDRQSKAENLFSSFNMVTIDNGDVVEVDGKHYEVSDVGVKYLRLVDTDGKVSRCKIDAARLVSKSEQLLSNA